MQDFERELTDLLENADAHAIVRFVKEKVLESYWNGTKATKKIDGDRGPERSVAQSAHNTNPTRARSLSRRT